MPPIKTARRVERHKIEEAVNKVIKTKARVRAVAAEYQISNSHLSRLVHIAKNSPNKEFKYEVKSGNKRFFSAEQEALLTDYLKTSAKMCYGLTKVQIRELAYQYALKLNKAPETWRSEKRTSREWLKNFLKRHKDLPLRKPWARTSNRRFSETDVQQFFDNLETIYQSRAFQPSMVWNLDETDCSTVPNTPEVITEAGVKRVGQNPAKQGSLVTMLVFVNAAGGTIPPVFLFPRVHLKNQMSKNGSTGAVGPANPSGWFNEENFLEALRHFVREVRPSQDKPALVIIDNPRSYITLDVVLFARENHVTILTLPPHCGRHLRPLEVSVFGPFKSRYDSSMTEWMTSNPGKTVAVNDVGQFAKEGFGFAFTTDNISSGFRNTGIYPLNRAMFSNNDSRLSGASNIKPESDPIKQELDTSLIPPKDDGPLPETTMSPTNNHVIDTITPLPGPSNTVTPSTATPNTSGTYVSKKRRKVRSTYMRTTPEKSELEESSRQDPELKKSKLQDSSKKDAELKKRKLQDSSKKDVELKKRKSQDSSKKDAELKKRKLQDSSKKDVDVKKNKPAKTLAVRRAIKVDSDSDDTECCVCKRVYGSNKEDWLQCRLCNRWANEKCGVQGTYNFFCLLCH